MKRNTKWIIAGVVLVGLAVIAAVVKRGDKAQASLGTSDKDDCTMAYVVSKKIIKDKFKTSQVSFRPEYRCDQEPKGYFKITAVAELHLSSGYNQPMEYLMLLRYKGEGSKADPANWRIFDYITQ